MGSSQLNTSLGQSRQFLLTPDISQWLLQGVQATQRGKGQCQMGTLWAWPMAHDAGDWRERGKAQNTMLFLPCCELSSAMTELNKIHTWFIFGLDTPPSSQIDLWCYCSVLWPKTPKALRFAVPSLLLPSHRCNCCKSEGEEGEGERKQKRKQGEKSEAADAHICFLTNSGYGTPVRVPFYC